MPPSANPPPATVAASAGSPALDPYMRAYLELRWRSAWTELRMIAPLLGWDDRLPAKQS